MQKQPIFYFTALILLLGVGILLVQNTAKPKAPQTPAPPASSSAKPILTSPPDIPTAVPVVPETGRGKVVSVNTSRLVLDVNGTTKEYSLSGVQDIQRVTSGSLEGGGLKTTRVSPQDLQVGQELYIIVDKNTGKIVSILIVK